MAELDHIPKTYEDACLALARSHADEVGFPIAIYCFPDPGKKEVRLVEVSDSFPINTNVSTYSVQIEPGTSGGPGQAKPVVPVVAMRPSDDFPFRSSVALVTQTEWEQILAGDLRIAGNWDIRRRRQVWPQ